jgi:hypothetical protein
VGAWINTGSLSSGGTHIRQRVPCCWKWHSSRLHSSTSRRLACCRSFLKAATRTGSDWATWGLPSNYGLDRHPQEAGAVFPARGAAPVLGEVAGVPEGHARLKRLTRRRRVLGTRRCGWSTGCKRTSTRSARG